MRISLTAIGLFLVTACGRNGATRADSARSLAHSAATGNHPEDAARVLEAQLQRELFNAKDTGFVRGTHSCDEGGEEQPPPGLALVKARVIGTPVPSENEPDEVKVRAVLTSVASTDHHEGGDEVAVNVAIGVRVDTVDFIVGKDENGYAICYTQLFLHRGAVGWAAVKTWTPPNGSWGAVARLADSVTASARR